MNKKQHSKSKPPAKAPPAKAGAESGLNAWERAANLEEQALREQQRWTMTEAAKQCGLTRPAISMHESQQRGMTLGTMVKIARAYGLKGPDFFLNGARRWFGKTALCLAWLAPEWARALAWAGGCA